MDKKKNENIQENVRAELGGLEIYGTTGNIEIGGYRMSGDIENAGRLDKGFEKAPGNEGAMASWTEEKQRKKLRKH